PAATVIELQGDRVARRLRVGARPVTAVAARWYRLAVVLAVAVVGGGGLAICATRSVGVAAVVGLAVVGLPVVGATVVGAAVVLRVIGSPVGRSARVARFVAAALVGVGRAL